MPLKLMYITNNPQIALIAEKNGVDRIWIDLETLGKEERQKNMNSVKSHHNMSDVSVMSNTLTTSELLVRINPWNENSIREINQAIDAGADIIMLPMWRSVDEVQRFLSIVEGRVRTMLLLETREADECLDDVLKLPGIDEIHIGLNDLHLSYGLTFMFELLANGTVERLCREIAAAGIPYGFGGIAKIGDGMLPAEKIIMEHYRLGSTRAILSRTFCDNTVTPGIHEIEKIFTENMTKLRMYEAGLVHIDKATMEKNHLDVCESVDRIVHKIKERKRCLI